ncbi:septal ring lytic transglycosylase RlpA family protein [Caldovatus sp. SYSU G05006]|uniref:Endolytic peptidoglycan transglycosylase RlpA n=2 Tax=Caldovatus aquaticus TaxID=2865671 RepID=A0ABS7F1N6_9PROT|nr:septal ring lytic transglycosylase RlpA family protein [Caldovatus aquaticus]
MLALGPAAATAATERQAEVRRPEAGQAAGPAAAARPPQRGEASYYHPRFAGRPMANGEPFDTGSDSAAHRTLPLGTRATVTNLENGRTAEVTIEDRGPYVRGRIIDVSPATAEELGMRRSGTAPVEVRPLEVPGRSEGGERR